MKTLTFNDDELEYILAALSLMQDMDDDNGRGESAASCRAIIDRITAQPEDQS